MPDRSARIGSNLILTFGTIGLVHLCTLLDWMPSIKAHTSRLHYYMVGKKRVSIVVCFLALVGGTIDLSLYYEYYGLGLRILGFSLPFIAVTLLASYFLRAIPYRVMYLAISWVLINDFLFSHIFFYTKNPDLVPLSQHFFFRDLMFITCILPLTGFIGNRVHAVLQGVAGIGLILFYTFRVESPFVVTNSTFLIIVEIANILSVAFMSTYLHRFIKSLNYHKRGLENVNKEIMEHLRVARDVQSSQLPSRDILQYRLLDYFVFYKPKHVVSGDFYWMDKTSECLKLGVADATGHGVSAAMVSLVCINALNRASRDFHLNDPGQLLDKTGQLVSSRFGPDDQGPKDGMDISLCIFKDDGLYFSGAHNPLWVIRATEKSDSLLTMEGPGFKVLDSPDGKTKLFEIKATRQAIGKLDSPAPFKTHFLPLQKGDVIYMSTDGYADQFGGAKNKKFKPANLKRLLLEIHHLPMSQQCEQLDRQFRRWKGNSEQVDDVCVFGLRLDSDEPLSRAS